jgi:hypothetical protein
MRKIILPLFTIAALSVSSAAMAYTDHTTTGAIKALDTKACTVTLDNKDVFHVVLMGKAKCDLSAWKVGEKVKVTWHVHKKVDWATKIVKA